MLTSLCRLVGWPRGLYHRLHVGPGGRLHATARWCARRDRGVAVPGRGRGGGVPCPPPPRLARSAPPRTPTPPVPPPLRGARRAAKADAVRPQRAEPRGGV